MPWSLVKICSCAIFYSCTQHSSLVTLDEPLSLLLTNDVVCSDRVFIISRFPMSFGKKFVKMKYLDVFEK